MRLIDADALEDMLGIEDEDIYCKEIIREAPTVEAKPVVHGEWVDTHEHKWKLDENGEIDECSWFEGYHNGVTCEICGERICVHCRPNWKESTCYETSYKCSVCGSHEKEKSNFCKSCGADMRKKVAE